MTRSTTLNNPSIVENPVINQILTMLFINFPEEATMGYTYCSVAKIYIGKGNATVLFLTRGLPTKRDYDCLTWFFPDSDYKLTNMGISKSYSELLQAPTRFARIMISSKSWWIKKVEPWTTVLIKQEDHCL